MRSGCFVCKTRVLTVTEFVHLGEYTEGLVLQKAWTLHGSTHGVHKPSREFQHQQHRSLPCAACSTDNNTALPRPFLSMMSIHRPSGSYQSTLSLRHPLAVVWSQSEVSTTDCLVDFPETKTKKHISTSIRRMTKWYQMHYKMHNLLLDSLCSW